jgi:hypothetical protein
LIVEFKDEGETITGVRLTGDGREIFGGELLPESWSA